MEEAPIPKVSIALVMAEGSSLKTNFSRVNQMEISKRPRPTTVKPITEPAENATRRPRFRLVRQALAVRQLALVAMRMPMKPDRPEKKPPVTNAKGTNQVSRPVAAMMHSTTNMQAKKMATMVYWRFR